MLPVIKKLKNNFSPPDIISEITYEISDNLANSFIEKQKQKYGYGIKKTKHKRRKRKNIKKQRKFLKLKRGNIQHGGGVFDVFKNIFGTLKNAARVAEYSDPKSPFRLANQMKYGLPSALSRKMYRYR